MPDWFLECPELLPSEEMYLRAFWDLRTEARSGDTTLARIPWSVARRYAREALGFEKDMLGPFWRIICALDAAFLEWMKNEHDRFVRMNKPTETKNGNKSRSKRAYGR